MGYKVKLQKINRSANYTYCVTVPLVLAEAMGLSKGEELEWAIEDKNTLILTRQRPVPLRRRKTGSKST